MNLRLILFPVRQTSRKNHNMQHALEYIHNNFSTDISLDRVAGTAGISKYHFSRLFKEMTGLTYQSYVNRVRIEQAKKLLNDDALSITDAGYAVGYSDLTHFERIFKKLTGTTPSQYRRRTSSLPASSQQHPVVVAVFHFVLTFTTPSFSLLRCGVTLSPRRNRKEEQNHALLPPYGGK